MRDPKELRPHPQNANRHPDDQLRLYAKIIARQGWRKAIVVSQQSGFVITGHGALAAALRAKWASVPVDVQTFSSSEDEKAHMLADNRLSELAETDETTLQAVLSDLSQSGYDLELTALDIGEIPDAAAQVKNPAGRGMESDDEPPESVKENLAELSGMKKLRKSGTEAVISKNDTESYLVLVFADRDAKNRTLKAIGLPEDERYLSASDFSIRRRVSAVAAIGEKTGPSNKTGSQG